MYAWSNAIGSSWTEYSLYGGTGAIDAQTYVLPEYGCAKGNTNDDRYDQYLVNYHAEDYQRLAQQMCTSQPLESDYAQTWDWGA